MYSANSSSNTLNPPPSTGKLEARQAELPPEIAAEIEIAERTLTGVDPVMARLITAHAPCTLLRGELDFEYVVYTIIGQQISTKAAASVRDRLRDICGAISPRNILALSGEKLRGAGLSLRKTETIRTLAREITEKRISFSEFHEQSNEEIISTLTTIKGIGTWTVEMLLIFTMGRLDVFPIKDGAIVAMMSELYGVARKDLAGLKRVAEKWRPYRSVACWYLYRYKNSKV